MPHLVFQKRRSMLIKFGFIRANIQIYNANYVKSSCGTKLCALLPEDTEVGNV
jgi:hypothetical protein